MTQSAEAGNGFYEGMVRRLGRNIALSGVCATLVALVGWGPIAALGVAGGAGAAFLNFRWIERAYSKPGGISAALFVLRFGLLGLAGYAMLKVFGVSPGAFLAGLLTAAVAALIEVLYQVIYARSS